MPIVIEGESGTGKTTLAREIHRISPRRAGPFCHVLLSAIDDSLAASELFGHEAGAFTGAIRKRIGQFASANGGTLLLDEVGKASLSVQQKLLDAIESRQIRPLGADRIVRIDTRIILATNVSLQILVDSGLMLPDLFARVETYRVELPPLRDRWADIPALVDVALNRHAVECGYSHVPVVSQVLMDALVSAPWPNNLRQLDATIQRLLIDAEGAAVLDLSHCGGPLGYLRELKSRPALTPDAIAEAIAREGGVRGAARSLGVHRTTIYRHLREEQRMPERMHGR